MKPHFLNEVYKVDEDNAPAIEHCQGDFGGVSVIEVPASKFVTSLTLELWVDCRPGRMGRMQVETEYDNT